MHSKQVRCQLSYISSPYFQFCFIFICIYLCMFLYGPKAHVWESQENLSESALSFHHVGCTQVVGRLHGKHLSCQIISQPKVTSFKKKKRLEFDFNLSKPVFTTSQKQYFLSYYSFSKNSLLTGLYRNLFEEI